MKTKILIVIIVLCAIYMIKSGCMPRQEIGVKYPDFTLTSAKGEEVSLSSFNGKSIVVLGIGNPYT